MKLSTLLSLGFLWFSLLPLMGQETDSLVSSESILTTPADSLVALDSSQVAIESDSLPQMSPMESLLMARIDSLERRLGSLQTTYDRAKAAARRRLRMDVFVDSFRQYQFYACVVDPQEVDIQLFNRYRRRKVYDFYTLHQEAEAQGKDLVFAMNAGMYERNRVAKGLLVVGGEREQRLDTLTKGYGNFYMQPNGVFALDSAGYGYVIPTQQYDSLATQTQISYATQSGPMMLIDGNINPLFNDGSPNRHIRNAVGVTADNQVVFAISRRRVTFFELSSFMLGQGCVHALYLDGAISQVYMPQLGIKNLQAGNHLGPIVGILK